MPGSERLRSEPLPAEMASIGQARHMLAAFLRDLPAGAVGTASLLASELVTNAVRHARTPFRLCAAVDPPVVRVEVSDGSTDPPILRHPHPDEVTGRGLLLVSELAQRWGTQRIPDGKMVWFELDLDAA